MFCEQCGTEVKDTERFCPKCGTPVQSGNNAQQTPGGQADKGLPQVDVGKMADTVSQTVSNAADTVSQTVSAAADEAKKALKNLSGNKKGILDKIWNPKTRIPIIAGAAGVLAVAVVAANGARLGNFFRKTFSSPEKYYQSVEKQTVQEVASSFGDVYGSYLESVGTYDSSTKVDLEFNVGRDAEELMDLVDLAAGMAGIDLDWLKSAAVSVEYSMKDDVYGGSLSISANKDKLFSGSMALDAKNESIYFQIPDWSKYYIGVDMEGYVPSESFELLQERKEYSKALLKALPKQAKVEKLIKKYLNIALSNVDDVSVKKGRTLKAEGISQEYTELTIKLDDDMVKDILEAVLEEMQDDKDIEELIADYCDALQKMEDALDIDVPDGDDMYEEFQDEIDYMLDELDRYGAGLGDDKITMKVYVDGKGRVRGRTLEYDDVTISMKMPQKGGKVGYEFSVKSTDYYDAISIALSGTGKESGGKLKGNFELKYNNMAVAEIAVKDMDLDKWKKLQPNGSFEIGLPSSLTKLLKGSYSSGSRYSSYEDRLADMMIEFIGKLKITLKADSSNKSGELALGLTYDGEKALDVSLAAKRESASKISIPSSKNAIMVEDFDDLVEWLETVNWDKVVSNLAKTSLPDEWVDAIEDIADLLEDGNIGRLLRYF